MREWPLPAKEQLSNSNFQWRPAEETDREFLLHLFEEVHGQELRLLPLAPAQLSALLAMQQKAQEQHYRSFYSQSSHHVLWVSGQKAGRLWLAEQDRELRVIEIALLPSYQGLGLGTAVFHRLIEQAMASQCPLRLSVQRSNQRAQCLYRRLGFIESRSDALQIEMGYSPILKENFASL